MTYIHVILTILSSRLRSLLIKQRDTAYKNFIDVGAKRKKAFSMNLLREISTPFTQFAQTKTTVVGEGCLLKNSKSSVVMLEIFNEKIEIN